MRVTKRLINWLPGRRGWNFCFLIKVYVGKQSIFHTYVWREIGEASFSNLVVTRIWTKLSTKNSDLPIIFELNCQKISSPTLICDMQVRLLCLSVKKQAPFFTYLKFKTFPNVTSKTVKSSFWNFLCFLKKATGSELTTRDFLDNVPSLSTRALTLEVSRER